MRRNSVQEIQPSPDTPPQTPSTSDVGTSVLKPLKRSDSVLGSSFIEKIISNNTPELNKTEIDTYTKLFAEAINQVNGFLEGSKKAKLYLILLDKCKNGKKSRFTSFVCQEKIGLREVNKPEEEKNEIWRAIDRFNEVATLGELASREIIPVPRTTDRNDFGKKGKEELRKILGDCLEGALKQLEQNDSAFINEAKKELDNDPDAAKPRNSCFSAIAKCFGAKIVEKSGQSSPSSSSSSNNR